jgi:hypothetical protein
MHLTLEVKYAVLNEAQIQWELDLGMNFDASIFFQAERGEQINLELRRVLNQSHAS